MVDNALRTIYSTMWFDGGKIVEFLENCGRPIYYIPVKWKPPNGTIMKSISRKSWRCSCDFCLRNRDGDLICAQGKEIHEGTNIEVEAIPINEALAHCVTEAIPHICLETDSLVLTKVLIKVRKVPWNIVIIDKNTWYSS